MLPGPIVVRTAWNVTPMPGPTLGIGVPFERDADAVARDDGSGGQLALDDDAAPEPALPTTLSVTTVFWAPSSTWTPWSLLRV